MENQKLGQEPAFITVEYNTFQYHDGSQQKEQSIDSGMNKRFYAACAAMQGLLSGADRHSQTGDCAVWNYEHLAKISFKAADELLKQENQ